MKKNGKTEEQKNRFIGVALIATLCLFIPRAAFASTVGATFQRLPLDARSAALGGASGALSEGVGGMHANPAALAGLKALELRGGNLEWLEGSALRSVGAGFAAKPGLLVVGAQTLFFGSGAIDEVKETALGDAVPTGNSFEVSQSLVRLAAAGGLPVGGKRRLEMGLALVVVYRDFYLQRDGQMAVDLGLRYGNEGPGFRLSAALQHWGGSLGPDAAPTRFNLGGRAQIGEKAFQNLAVAVQAQVPLREGDPPAAGAGLEYGLGPYASLRAGHRFLDELASWSLGMGLKGGPPWLKMELDFAWLPMDSFGGRQVWTLGMKF